MAPELFTETENLLPTKASDIYALSMTFLAIITLRPPFSEYAHDFGASYACQKGMRPNKPKEVVTLTQAQADALWDLLELMWQQEPCARPRATDVFEYLRRKLRHHGDSTRLPESPATYPKSRARTMSSSAISKHQKFSVNNGTGINKSLKRLDDAQRELGHFYVILDSHLNGSIQCVRSSCQGFFCAINAKACDFGRMMPSSQFSRSVTIAASSYICGPA